MIENILNSVKDFEDRIEDGTIKVCMLRPYSKISIDGWYGFKKLYELKFPENIENNIGISLVGQEVPNEPVLTCIDIDGDKRVLNKISVEQFSKDWMFEILTSKLDDLEIKYMAVKSSSGGYHIYVYTMEPSSRYLSTRDLVYPKNKKAAAVSENLSMFLSGNHREAEQLYEDQVPHSIIEVWCDKRYMVAPGSTIYDKKNNTYNDVELLEKGVDRFDEIGVVKDNLNQIIREALIESGFKEEYTHKNLLKSTEIRYAPQDLSEENIKKVGELLLEWLPLIDGQKHTFCLAMSGFLYNKQISLDSIQKIAYYVTKRCGNLFDSNEQFVDTLLHDTKKQDKARLQSGLPSMEEILSPFYSKEYIGKKLHLLLNPDRHRFWPEGKYASQYHEILIDYNSHYMLRNKIRVKTNKEGEVNESVASTHKIFNSIDSIKYLNDISELRNLKITEYPISIDFTDTRGNKHTHEFNDVLDAINTFTKIPGSHGDASKLIMESIFNEFETLDLIDEVESCSRTGYWISPSSGKIVRYINDKDKIVEDNPEYPSKTNVVQSLRLLKRLKKVYPWQEGKFSSLMRMCLTMPYSYILKYEYNSQHPSVILYGESGALKSSAASLSMYLHWDFLKYKGYIVTGSEMNSEYRFALNLDNTTFPLVVEEPEHLFYRKDIREIIKSAAFNTLIREPGGKDSKPYYSRRTSIYTMNTLPNAADNPEFLRRFFTIDFDISERGDTPEVIEKLSFLNTNGIINKRFSELHYIGDYIYHLLNDNMQWFELSLEELQSNIIDGLEKYSGEDLSFLREEIKDYSMTDRSSHANNTLNLILRILKRPYLYSRGKYIHNDKPMTYIRDIINNNPDYSYIHFVKQKNKDSEPHILIDIGFKEAYNNFYFNEGRTITLNNVLLYLKELDIDFDCLKMTPCYIEGRKKQVRGIKMSLKDFVRILTGKQDI